MKFDPDYHPELIHDSAFIAGNATIVGRVSMREGSSVWFGSVVRGDTESISIGPQSNIQDLSVLHADAGVACSIGARVTVGHCAIVHGAVIEDDVMIGMRAVVLNHVRIGSHSIVAAGAVVPEGTIIPPRSVVMGVPGKIVRETSEHDMERIAYAANHYVEAAEAFRANASTEEGDGDR